MQQNDDNNNNFEGKTNRPNKKKVKDTYILWKYNNREFCQLDNPLKTTYLYIFNSINAKYLDILLEDI